MARIRIELGTKKQYVFERDYNEKEVETVKAMVKDYLAFYNAYRASHTISAKRWNFPYVNINGENRYKVTPNGSWYDEKTDRKVFG